MVTWILECILHSVIKVKPQQMFKFLSYTRYTSIHKQSLLLQCYYRNDLFPNIAPNFPTDVVQHAIWEKCHLAYADAKLLEVHSLISVVVMLKEAQS